MRLFIEQIKNAVVCTLGVAIVWTVFFKLNTFVFSYLEKNQFVNLVFLPAGIRLVSVLLFDELAVMGLFLGALFTSSSVFINPNETLIISLISALNPYIAVHVTKNLLKIDKLLKNIRAKELILIGIFSAGLNSISHHLYFHYSHIETSWANCENMFIGDLLGISIVLYLFSLSLKLIRKSTLSTIVE